MADIVISHGGQGTVQTAIVSGTLIVGMAMQPEQQINHDNVVFVGGAIRIPKHRWKSKAINHAVKKIASVGSFRKCMEKLKQDMDGVDEKKAQP
jgi:UDP:flavonoid glycosyltransferase YjiC (YdhE family)